MPTLVEEKATLHRLHRTIDLAGVLAIWIGLSAITGMVIDFMDEGVQINPLFVALPVGLGILRRKKESLGCVIQIFGLITIFALLVTLVIGGVMIFSAPSRKELFTWTNRGEVASFALQLGVGIVFLVLVAKTFFQLRKPEIYRLYSQESRENAQLSPPWLMPLIVVMLFSEVGRIADNLAWTAEKRAIFPVSVQIEVYDEESGEPLEAVRAGWVSSSGEDGPLLKSFTQQFESGNTVILREGIAKKPFKFRVGADGYEERAIEINSSTGDLLKVQLRKADQASTEEKALAPPPEN